MSESAPALCGTCTNYQAGQCGHLAFIREATGEKTPVFQFCPLYDKAPPKKES